MQVVLSLQDGAGNGGQIAIPLDVLPFLQTALTKKLHLAGSPFLSLTDKNRFEGEMYNFQLATGWNFYGVVTGGLTSDSMLWNEHTVTKETSPAKRWAPYVRETASTEVPTNLFVKRGQEGYLESSKYTDGVYRGDRMDMRGAFRSLLFYPLYNPSPGYFQSTFHMDYSIEDSYASITSTQAAYLQTLFTAGIQTDPRVGVVILYSSAASKVQVTMRIESIADPGSPSTRKRTVIELTVLGVAVSTCATPSQYIEYFPNGSDEVTTRQSYRLLLWYDQDPRMARAEIAMQLFKYDAGSSDYSEILNCWSGIAHADMEAIKSNHIHGIGNVGEVPQDQSIPSIFRIVPEQIAIAFGSRPWNATSSRLC